MTRLNAVDLRLILTWILSVAFLVLLLIVSAHGLCIRIHRYLYDFFSRKVPETLYFCLSFTHYVILVESLFE